jgi:hypothetical protein
MAAFCEVGVSVKPIHPLVIDLREVCTQQVMDASTAKPATYMGDIYDAFAQITGGLI